MNSAVLITLITLVGGFVFWCLQRVIDKRYAKTKEAIEENTADVQNMSTVVAGFKSLNDGYKAKIEELEKYQKELLAENVKLRQEVEVLTHGSS